MFHRMPSISIFAVAATALVLLLTVLFASSLSSPGTAHAQDNSAPEFDEGATAERNVPETAWQRTTDYPPFMENNNRDAGDPVTATDADSGDTLTYSISGTGAGYFKIDSSTGQIRTEEPLDYESDQASYTVTVSVHDGKDSSSSADTTIDDTITVTITLTDVNEPPKPSRREGEPPPGYDGDMEFEIPENSTGPMIFFLEDPEGRGEGWIVSPLSGDSDLFYADDDAGSAHEQHLYFKEPPDYENPRDGGGNNDYDIILLLYDTNPYPGESQPVQTFPNVKIRVTDVEETNENPEFTDSEITRSVAENTAAGVDIGEPVAADVDDDNGTLTYTLGGTDAESFDIDAETGQLQVKDALDHETKPIYTVTVSVGDGKDLQNSADEEIDDEITVTIEVTNVNEPPRFAAEAAVELNIPENTEANRPVGAPVSATDDENDTLTYTLGGTDTASFDFDTTTGQIKTKDALDHETKQSYSVTVSVTDGKDVDGNTENAATPDDSIGVTIEVTDVNEPPQFAADAPPTQTVAENTVAETNIGEAYAATDPENDTPLTYSLGGTDAASFAIDDATGQLKTKADLNFEADPGYTVTLSVTDGKDAAGTTETNPTIDDTHTVTITVTDEDDLRDSLVFSGTTHRRDHPGGNAC